MVMLMALVVGLLVTPLTQEADKDTQLHLYLKV
jgi:hypothetical protein